MPGIYIADINALQEFEYYLPAFLSGFSAECRELREIIRDTLDSIEVRLDEAQEDLDSAVEAASGGEDEDDSSGGDWAVEEAEVRLQQWNAYRGRFEAFAEGGVEIERRVDDAFGNAASDGLDLAVLDDVVGENLLRPRAGFGGDCSRFMNAP